jgi:hypothetical protein
MRMSRRLCASVPVIRKSTRGVCLPAWLIFYLGKEQEAATWLRRSVETNRNFPTSHFVLAAALARLGRHPEARSEVQGGLAIAPTMTIARFRAGALGDHPNVLAGRERLIDGLRQAGLPEE